jgi:hypothetical protein
MTQEPPKTISIPVPAALHTAIGVLLALVTITAFWAHIELPAGHSNKGTAVGVGLLSGCTALTYWLWCGQQCTRAETKDVGEAIVAAEAKAAEREERLLAVLRECADQLRENGSAIKELKDAVDGNTEAVAEAIGAVEALQDSYTREGKPDHPEGQTGAEEHA